MQASLEAESRAKAEALRIKKKLEADINELEIALDHANKANAEAHKGIKRFQGQLRDVEGLFEDESRQRRELAEKSGLADDVQMHFMANLKNPGHYWILLIVPRNKLIWNWQNLVLLSMTWLQSTQRLHLISANLKEQFTPCMLKLMICLPKLRVVKKKPKRLWLMLLVLLMNSEQSKSIPTLKKKQREHWSLAFVSLRLSLEMFNAELLKTTKDSKRLIVELRSFNSNKMKIIKMPTECLT